jgi:hypothetical protein
VAFADERGSSLPLYIGLIAVLLVFASAIVDASSLFLFQQRMQLRADQLVLNEYEHGQRTSGETLEIEECATWQAPLKAIGLPSSQQVCARSAAR